MSSESYEIHLERLVQVKMATESNRFTITAVLPKNAKVGGQVILRGRTWSILEVWGEVIVFSKSR